MMHTIGKLLRPIRAGLARSPLSDSAFDAPDAIAVTSTAFNDGAAIPTRYAGNKVAPPRSPATVHITTGS